MREPIIKQIDKEKRFQLLVEAVTDYAIYLLDPEGRIVSWNSGAQRIKGYTSAEVIGRQFSIFFTDEDRAAGKPLLALETARRTGRFEDEAWLRRKDGSNFWALAVLDAIRDEKGNLIGFAKITRDMTERQAAQQALVESERRFRLLVNGAVDYAIFMLDADGRVTNWNSGAQHIKGYTSEEIVGEHFSRFYSQEDRAAGLPEKALRRVREQGKFADEGWRVRKDGSRFWANVVIDPIRDETGKLIGYAKITRDMTEQREAQLKLDEAREQLFQAQKMEAIGQLTGGIAHDFNNLLTVIIGGADLAEAQVKDNEKLKRLIGNMRHAALRGESLTKQLLAFSRRQPLKPELVDLFRQVKTVVDLLSRSLRSDIQIVSDIPSDLWPIYVDPGQFELALLNIGLNARDAMAEGGVLRITARNFVEGENAESGSPYVVVDIEDPGIGMTEEVKARAFEPFFTTKDIGRNSGLGLSQAYGFAKQSGGALILESLFGKGTKVSLRLPAMPSLSVPQAPEQPALHSPPASRATVLLVEDDPSVAELAVGLLQGAGYEVVTVTTAAAALDALRNGLRVDLLFSDIMMPGGMNGAELARVVREEFPSVFVLLATGYAQAAAHALSQEFSLIRKPYGRARLLDELTKILGDPPCQSDGGAAASASERSAPIRRSRNGRSPEA
jgi:PAS domain S-box-containing protein